MRKANNMLCIGTLCAAMLFQTGCGKAERLAKQEEYKETGIAFLQQEEYKKAEKAFQEGLNLSKGKVDAEVVDLCFYKAEAQDRLGDFDGAYETYTSLIDYDEDSNAYYLRGKIQLEQENPDLLKIREDFDAAIKGNKSEFKLYIGIYNCLNANGEKAQALTYLEKALDIKCKSADDYLKKGQIALILEKKGEAKKNLEKALEKEAVAANYYLAELAEEEGDTEAAEAYKKAFVESGEANSLELENLGVEQLNAGNYDQAVKYFSIALQQDSVTNRQSLMRNCIKAYEYYYDFASAKEMMDEYLTLYPEDEEAQRESYFLSTRVGVE